MVFYLKYLNLSLRFAEISYAGPRFLVTFHKSKRCRDTSLSPRLEPRCWFRWGLSSCVVRDAFPHSLVFDSLSPSFVEAIAWPLWAFALAALI